MANTTLHVTTINRGGISAQHVSNLVFVVDYTDANGETQRIIHNNPRESVVQMLKRKGISLADAHVQPRKL